MKIRSADEWLFDEDCESERLMRIGWLMERLVDVESLVKCRSVRE